MINAIPGIGLARTMNRARFFISRLVTENLNQNWAMRSELQIITKDHINYFTINILDY